MRSATLDRVEREFEPPLASYAAAIAVSPDDRLVAARAQSDTILVGNANTGALVTEIRHSDLIRVGHRTLTSSAVIIRVAVYCLTRRASKEVLGRHVLPGLNCGSRFPGNQKP